MSAPRSPLLHQDQVSMALCRMDVALHLVAAGSPPEIRQGLLAGIALAEVLLNQPRPSQGSRPASSSSPKSSTATACGRLPSNHLVKP